MRKKRYGIIIACLLVSAVGFGTVYGVEEIRQNKAKQEQSQAVKKQNEQSTQKNTSVSGVIEPKKSNDQSGTQVAKTDTQNQTPGSTQTAVDPQSPEPANQPDSQAQSKETANLTDTLLEAGISKPAEGEVLLPYSMDKTIYFPTLDQYRCNPAMILRAQENDKVKIVAKGTIKEIIDDEETGCTVIEDLGGGYTAIYGQLKDLNFKEGEAVEAGHVIGYVAAPTKYYVVEGANVYFELLKDGEPVNPTDYFR